MLQYYNLTPAAIIQRMQKVKCLHPLFFCSFYTLVITSSSTREYTVSPPDSPVRTLSYMWRQRITFQSCPHAESIRSVPPSQQLSIDQVFVMYDSANQLIRYAMSNKVGPVSKQLYYIISSRGVNSVPARNSYIISYLRGVKDYGRFPVQESQSFCSSDEFDHC